MKLPYWLLRLLPMFEYICPKCKATVKKNSHKCSSCGEKYPIPLKIPPRFLEDQKKLEEYVHKYIFPKISKFQRDYLAQYFTVFLSDGFENGFTPWTGQNKNYITIAVDTNVAHSGTHSARVTGTIGASESYAYTYYTLSVSQSAVYVRCYVYYTILPPGGFVNNMTVSGFVDTSLNWVTQATVDPTNNVWGIDNTPLGTTIWESSSTMTIQTGVWYCVELYTLVGSTTGAMTLWVNDVQKISQTNINTGTNNISWITIGYDAFYPGATVDANMDDVVIADVYNGPISTASPSPIITWIRPK